jgi:four helix bundle protein
VRRHPFSGIAICAISGNKEFRRYLSMARAELMEVQNDVIDLERQHLVTQECVTELKALADHALRITTLLRSSLKG